MPFASVQLVMVLEDEVEELPGICWTRSGVSGGVEGRLSESSHPA